MRQGFVRKVLGLVLLQLLITAGASFAFLYVQPLKVRAPQRKPDPTLCVQPLKVRAPPRFRRVGRAVLWNGRVFLQIMGCTGAAPDNVPECMLHCECRVIQSWARALGVIRV